MAWEQWYREYERSPSLRARLEEVCRQVAAGIGESGAGVVRVVSMCGGDGRDVMEGMRRSGRVVEAWVLDLDEGSLERGRRGAEAAGFGGRVRFCRADAGVGRSYEGVGRGDVVVMSGFLGHLGEEEVRRAVEGLPMVVRRGGSVVWSRHLVMNGGRRVVPGIREWLRGAGFEEVEYGEAGGFAVGRGRFVGAEAEWDGGRVLFEFAGGKGAEVDGPTGEGGGRWEEVEMALPAVLARRVAERAGEVAVDGCGGRMSYGELNEAGNRVARGVLGRGGAVGDRVAMLMRQDGGMVAGILGVLKAGRVVVVVNASDPVERLRQILEHAGASLVLTDGGNRELAERVAAGKIGVMGVEECAGESAEEAGVSVEAGAVAWLIYTSGSTGVPKAVMQTHRNIIHNAMRNAGGLGLREEDRVVWLASPSGGQGVGTMWATLLNGATLCPYAMMERGVEELGAWMERERISVWVSAVSVFREFVKTLGERRLGGVRVVRLASEAATGEDFGAFGRHFGEGCVMLLTLSSSETGNITQCRMRAGEVVGEGRLPVGRAVPGVEIVLVDEEGREGEEGEIVVRSGYLSPGYWRDEKLTAERFKTVEGTGMREYRTGDLARRMGDGRLVFAGRKDNRVKVHGYRIELSEVEGALERQKGVERAVVVAEAMAGDAVRLVAYVVMRRGEAARAEELRGGLRGVLPGYMVPGAVVFLEALPLTAGGKVDRRRLPAAPKREMRARGAGHVPRDQVEKMLAEIWEGVLGVEGIGRDENFFDLGGDSLQALGIVARIEKELGTLPPLSVFLDAGTIERQAGALCLPMAGLKSTVVPLQVKGEGVPLYCVHGAGGEVFSFSGLARGLGPEVPVYGLQSPGLLGEWPPGTIEGFAQRHVEEIVRQHGKGPCAVAGHCAGGMLALEVARQLAAAGKTVVQVGLIDVKMPGKSYGARTWSARKRFTDWVAQRVRIMRWDVKRQMATEAQWEKLRQGAGFRRFADYAFKDALRRYEIKRYEGAAAAFVCEEKATWEGEDTREMFLRAFVPGAKVWEVKGGHLDCLKMPHVESLIRAMRESLLG